MDASILKNYMELRPVLGYIGNIGMAKGMESCHFLSCLTHPSCSHIHDVMCSYFILLNYKIAKDVDYIYNF